MLRTSLRSSKVHRCFYFFVPISLEFLRIFTAFVKHLLRLTVVFVVHLFSLLATSHLTCILLLLKMGDTGFFEATHKVYSTSSVLALPLAHPVEEKNRVGDSNLVWQSILNLAHIIFRILLETVTVPCITSRILFFVYLVTCHFVSFFQFQNKLSGYFFVLVT